MSAVKYLVKHLMSSILNMAFNERLKPVKLSAFIVHIYAQLNAFYILRHAQLNAYLCTTNRRFTESPRGIDFLLDKNRINVAISRAQTLAVVVANSNLGNMSVNNVEQLKKVNLFNAMSLMNDRIV